MEIIRNGKNILSMQEIGMDEPGGVIRMTLDQLIHSCEPELHFFMDDASDELLMRLADWGARDAYKNCCLHDAYFIYIAQNLRKKKFKIKYYLNSHEARMYMATCNPSRAYVMGVVCDLQENPISNDIDLSMRQKNFKKITCGQGIKWYIFHHNLREGWRVK